MQMTSGLAKLNFRKMQERDIPFVEQLVQAAYRGGMADVAWKNEHDIVSGPRITESGLHDLLHSSRSLVVVAEKQAENEQTGSQAELCGCVLVEEEVPGTVVVGMLAVGPNSQNLGLGRKLVEAAESTARQEFRAVKAHMHVACVRSELLAWYERLGYAKTGEMKPFPGPEAGIQPLREGLEFAVIEKIIAE